MTIYQRYDQELADKIIAEIRGGAKTTIACHSVGLSYYDFCRWRNDRPGLQHRVAVAQSEWRERRSEQVEEDRRKRREERESSARAEVDQLLDAGLISEDDYEEELDEAVHAARTGRPLKSAEELRLKEYYAATAPKVAREHYFVFDARGWKRCSHCKARQGFEDPDQCIPRQGVYRVGPEQVMALAGKDGLR